MKKRNRTYDEVMAEIEALKIEAEDIKRREREGVIDRIREAMVFYNIKPTELAVPRRKRALAPAPEASVRRKKPVKYADGVGNKWSGGGSMPVWLRNYVEAGHSIEDFRVGAVSLSEHGQHSATG